MRICQQIIICLVIGIMAVPLSAGEADVISVKVKKTDTNIYQFDVTVEHADEGWKHYADKW